MRNGFAKLEARGTSLPEIQTAAASLGYSRPPSLLTRWLQIWVPPQTPSGLIARRTHRPQESAMFMVTVL